MTTMGPRRTYESKAIFKGKEVLLTNCDREHCVHDMSVMHHYGEHGEHYCPTGFISCDECGGIGHEPLPNECTRWGT